MILFTSCIFLVTDLHAQNYSITDISQTYQQNEYYKPLSPPARKQEMERSMERIDNINQYEGDHGYLWYRKHQHKRSWYINFHLNHSFFEDITDFKIKRLSYPDASVEVAEGDLSVNNTHYIRRKGNLGMEFALGYKRQNRFGYELEISHHKAVVTAVSLPIKEPEASGFGTIDEVEFSVTPITANLVVNLVNGIYFVPYIAAGIGYAAVGITKDYDMYPVEQYKAGMNYKLNEKMSINIAYKRIILGTIKYPFTLRSDSVTDTKYASAQYTIDHDQDFDVLSIGYKFAF